MAISYCSTMSLESEKKGWIDAFTLIVTANFCILSSKPACETISANWRRGHLRHWASAKLEDQALRCGLPPPPRTNRRTRSAAPQPCDPIHPARVPDVRSLAWTDGSARAVLCTHQWPFRDTTRSRSVPHAHGKGAQEDRAPGNCYSTGQGVRLPGPGGIKGIWPHDRGITVVNWL